MKKAKKYTMVAGQSQIERSKSTAELECQVDALTARCSSLMVLLRGAAVHIAEARESAARWEWAANHGGQLPPRPEHQRISSEQWEAAHDRKTELIDYGVAVLNAARQLTGQRLPPVEAALAAADEILAQHLGDE